ncbi:MAG TPA: class I SAM-dependent methyltransferase [Anaerolineales bacterium]|nr:class I SAM-dependent methyltransferase [Anaerolineales bacterium]
MNPEQVAAEIYDQTVPDWPGEMDFYGAAARGAVSILEIACGTGRVALRLAAEGRQVFGFDLSPHAIELARRKSGGVPAVRWAVADMRSFSLGEMFDLVIVPGHSFQFMLGIAEQLSCLGSIQRHLTPGGRLVLHIDNQDLSWLGSLPVEAEGAFGVAQELGLPEGRRLQISKRWSYDPATQTASLITLYEELDRQGRVTDCALRGPLRMHCFFRTEMEHLLSRAGLQLHALYGDFSRAPLGPTSSEMIWVAGRPAATHSQATAGLQP